MVSIIVDFTRIILRNTNLIGASGLIQKCDKLSFLKLASSPKAHSSISQLSSFISFGHLKRMCEADHRKLLSSKRFFYLSFLTLILLLTTSVIILLQMICNLIRSRKASAMTPWTRRTIQSSGQLVLCRVEYLHLS